MMDKKAENLKKRLNGDSICTWVIAAIIGVVAISNVCTAIKMFIDANVSGATYVESPAFMMGEGIRKMLLAVVFVLLSLVLGDIKKNGKPFTKVNYIKLRVMAIITVCCVVVPMITASIAGFFDPQATFQLSFNTGDIIFAIAGAIIGIISEIFYYGYELQEEMDLIA